MRDVTRREREWEEAPPSASCSHGAEQRHLYRTPYHVAAHRASVRKHEGQAGEVQTAHR